MFKLNNPVKLNSTFGRSQKRQFNPLQYSPALWLDASDQSTLVMDGAASFAPGQGLYSSSVSFRTDQKEFYVSFWSRSNATGTIPAYMFLKGPYWGSDSQYGVIRSGTNLNFRVLDSVGATVSVNSTIGSTFQFYFFWVDLVGNKVRAIKNSESVATSSGSLNGLNSATSYNLEIQPIISGDGGEIYIDSLLWGKNSTIPLGDGQPGSYAHSLATYLYNSGAGRRSSDFINSSYYTGGNPSGAVSWWDLDERSGTRKDRIGTNDLTAYASSPTYASGIASGLVQYDGDPIKQWSDKSGNGRHVTAPSDAARPTYKTGVQNGRPALLFDGVNDVMSSPAFSLTDYSVYVVYKPITLSGGFCPVVSLNANTGMIGLRETNKWYDYNGGNSVLVESTGTAGIGSFVVMSSTLATNNAGLWVNGMQKAVSGSVTPAAMTSGVRFAFNSIGSYYNLNVVELIVYPSALSTSQRQQVERYLGNKWGITLS